MERLERLELAAVEWEPDFSGERTHEMRDLQKGNSRSEAV
jgi:hypothetical protein